MSSLSIKTSFTIHLDSQSEIDIKHQWVEAISVKDNMRHALF